MNAGADGGAVSAAGADDTGSSGHTEPDAAALPTGQTEPAAPTGSSGHTEPDALLAGPGLSSDHDVPEGLGAPVGAEGSAGAGWAESFGTKTGLGELAAPPDQVMSSGQTDPDGLAGRVAEASPNV